MENIFMNTYLEACKELQVNPNDKEEEIKKKYHDLLKKFHPDNKKEFANTEKVKKITIAFATIKKYREKQAKDNSFANHEIEIQKIKKEIAKIVKEFITINEESSVVLTECSMYEKYVEIIRKFQNVFASVKESFMKIDLEKMYVEIQKERVLFYQQLEKNIMKYILYLLKGKTV